MATVSRRCTGARGGHKGAGGGSAGREEGGRGPGGSASSVERAVTAERLESPRVTLSRCKCQKALFAAIAQNFGREGLHIMTACIRSKHEGCRTRHITVDGADDDLRNALATASDGVHRRQSRALSVASRASVSLQTRDKCGSGRLRPATDGPGPGKRQGRRGGELRGWRVGVRPCRNASATKRYFLISAHHRAFPAALLAQAHQ